MHPKFLQTVGRLPFTFTLQHQTRLGESLFVCGSLPELGANQLPSALKLSPYSYPEWTAHIDLPTHLDFSWQYFLRGTRRHSPKFVSNGQSLSPHHHFQTHRPTTERRRLTYYSGWETPHLTIYSETGTLHSSIPLQRACVGRFPGEWQYLAEFTAPAGVGVSFMISDGKDGVDRPSDRTTYFTALPDVWVRDGQVFNQPPPGQHTTSPCLVVHPSFASHHLGNERTIRVLLPRNYQLQPERRYPVLYMQDGQNCFHPGSEFGCWHADAWAERLTRWGWTSEFIIVAIDNMGQQRMNEYRPPESNQGRADDYVQFLVEEVKPAIDTHYRTLPGATNSALLGSSMGGLVSLFGGWTRPDIFGRVAALSPSFGLFPQITERLASEPLPPLRIYLDSGDSGRGYDGMMQTLQVRDLLMSKGMVLYRDLLHTVDTHAYHTESAWSRRLFLPMQWLFPARSEPASAPAPATMDSWASA